MNDLEPADGSFWRGLAVALAVSFLFYGITAYAFVKAAR